MLTNLKQDHFYTEESDTKNDGFTPTPLGLGETNGKNNEFYKLGQAVVKEGMANAFK